MKRLASPWLLLLFGLGLPLAAQEYRVGVAFDLGLPMGAFYNTSYGPAGNVNYTVNQGYNVGTGFALSLTLIPQDSQVAVRFSLTQMSFSGHANALEPGTLALEGGLHQRTYAFGTDAQVFFSGSQAAARTGTYLLGGLSLDQERFDTGASPFNGGIASSLNETRLALVYGLGHQFPLGSGNLRGTLELAYHKTLSLTNTAAGDPPAANYLRLSAGLLF
jgi:hypothetical protein